MHIALNIANAPANRPYAGGRRELALARAASERECDLLWQCVLSGQMDDAALDREMARNQHFRDYVLRMEGQREAA